VRQIISGNIDSKYHDEMTKQKYKGSQNKNEAWCSGESYLTESPGRRFEAASQQILRGEGLPRFFLSPDPTHMGASSTGSALSK